MNIKNTWTSDIQTSNKITKLKLAKEKSNCNNENVKIKELELDTKKTEKKSQNPKRN